MWIFRKSVKFRFFFIILIIIFLIALIHILTAFETIKSLSHFFSENYKNVVVNDKKNELKTAIQIAQNTIQIFYEKSLKVMVKETAKKKVKYLSDLMIHIIKTYYQEEKEKIPESQLKQRILTLIKQANYGGGEGYFFVLNDKGILLEHPYHPELIGKNILSLRDVKGKKFISEFLKVAKEKGGGWVEYYWPRPGKTLPHFKISYVVFFKPFKWIIGTGVYPSEYIEEFKSFAQKQALETLKHMRYGEGGSGYFWVMDETGKILMHPIFPQLIGKRTKISTAIIEQMGNRPSAFVTYKWVKPGEKISSIKISYVVRFAPWGWIIGTGMYMKDLEHKEALLNNHLESVIKTWFVKVTFITILIAIITLIVLKKFSENVIFKRLNKLNNHLSQMAEGKLTFLKEPIPEDEIGQIERNINQSILFVKTIHTNLIQIINAVREGLPYDVEIENVKGEFKIILELLHNFYSEIFKALGVIKDFSYSLEQGDLKEIIVSEEIPPIFNRILQRLDTARKNLLNILKEITNILIKIEEGNFDVKIEQEGQGVYKEILKGLEKIVENFKNVLKEIKIVSQEVLKGNLQVQIDENKFKGNYKEVIHYLNEIIFQLKEELKKRENLYRRERELLELRRLVEEDSTLEEIYQRIAQLIEKRFGIKKYAFYEMDQEPARILLPFKNKQRYCKPEIFENPSLCRANRLGKEVKGFIHDWGTECEYFSLQDKNYICIPFIFGEKTKYVLQIIVDPNDNLEEIFCRVKELCKYLNTILPIVEVKKLLKILEERSVKDSLTGLYNRHFLNEYLIKASELALRHGHTLGILMIDIDFFKKVNDEFGHDVGDIVLQQITEILKSRFRKADVVVRYGGEEFLVLLHDVEENKLIEIAEQIRIAVENTPFQTPQGPIKKTISIGVAVYPIDSKDIWQVIKFADIALYHAKKTGRNKVIRFTKDLIQ